MPAIGIESIFRLPLRLVVKGFEDADPDPQADIQDGDDEDGDGVGDIYPSVVGEGQAQAAVDDGGEEEDGAEEDVEVGEPGTAGGGGGGGGGVSTAAVEGVFGEAEAELDNEAGEEEEAEYLVGGVEVAGLLDRRMRVSDGSIMVVNNGRSQKGVSLP